MINILIVTNDTWGWMKKLNKSLAVASKIMSLNDTLGVIRNDMFHVDVRKSINDSSRGKRYNTIIIDKPIPGDIYLEVLRPSLKLVQFTENGKIIEGD